jgi:hypothetical protein
METVPLDGSRFLVRLSNGREAVAEYWEGPPGKEHWGGFGIDVTRSFFEGRADDDCSADMVGWRPLPQIEYDDEDGIPK